MKNGVRGVKTELALVSSSASMATCLKLQLSLHTVDIVSIAYSAYTLAGFRYAHILNPFILTTDLYVSMHSCLRTVEFI